MKAVSPVIPGRESEEIDLSAGTDGKIPTLPDGRPAFMPLPALRLGKRRFLTRYELSEEERRVVAETGTIYMAMTTFEDKIDDTITMPHKLSIHPILE